MAVDVGPQLIDGDHVVQLYADEEELLSVVAGYLGGALVDGDAVIVIATPAHRDAFAPRSPRLISSSHSKWTGS